MWTYYRNGIGPKKKKKKEDKEFVRFPPIQNEFGPKTVSQDHRGTRQTASERLQELFFSNSLTDHGHVDRCMRKKRPSNHQVVPHSKLSVETELEITAHLKYNLQQRHVKGYGQTTSHEGKGEEALNFLKTQTLMLKDKALRAFFHGAGNVMHMAESSKMLESSPALGEEEKEEEEEDEEKEREERGKDYADVSQGESSRTDSSPEHQESLSKETLVGAEVTEKEKCPVDQFDGAGHRVQASTLPEESSITPCHARERRFMLYLCGGYRDTVIERNALMENVYPRLYFYCKQRGYDLRMVDLRRGVVDPVSNRHDSAELHVETLTQYQQANGPNFFVFTGQKHEELTLPVSIPKDDFEAIVWIVERDKKKLSKRKQEEDGDVTDISQSSISTSTAGSFALEPVQSEQEHIESSGLLSESSVSQNSLSDGEDTAQLVRSWTDFDRDLKLLQTWYRLDQNRIPAVYRLLPISTHHPDILSRDPQRRKVARKVWRASCVRLWGVLQRSGPEAIGEEATAKLLKTVLDWEVEQGLGAKHPPEEFSHCYKRIITDLQFNLRNEYAPQFIDLHKSQLEVNQTLHSAHQRFIQNIHRQLRHTNIYETNIGWGRRGLSPKHNRSHQFYTDRLCSHFLRTVTSSLRRVMQVDSPKSSFDVTANEISRNRMKEEIMRHIRHGQKLEQGCVFRQGFMSAVKEAVEAPSQRPVMLLGEPGSGKSTTLARVARLLPSWIAGDVKVLVFFVGLTGESRNVRLLLKALCMQLAEIYSDSTMVSESLPELHNELHSLLDLVSAERPVALVLDGLDELSEEQSADLSWLYRPLPPHVHTILSTNTHSTTAQVLQKRAQPSVLSLPSLSEEDITSALHSKLEADRRRLQESQWKVLYQACLSCPSPLYLDAAYVETRLWSSFSPQESLTLPGELSSLYLAVLSRLEREYGENVVRRVASLMSLSRNGITEDELLELMARNRRVVKETTLLYPQPYPDSSSDCRPSIPCVLWARLRRDLGNHLTEAETDGTWVYRWTHSEFRRVAVQRYLKTADSKMAVHADYVDYFRGDADVSRKRVFQPLAWTLEESGKTSYVFNLRKLHGLPYHLIHSGQIIPLMSECLFNYEFLLHKTRGLSVLHVEEDLKAAVIPDKELLDVTVLSQTLELSRSVLLQDPCQLASQLLGRLYQVVSEDKPVAPGDPCRYTHLHALLAQCQRSSLPVLLPSFTCLLPPGGLTYTPLAGHMTAVRALAEGQKRLLAASCSEDGTLKLWNLEEGRVVRTLPSPGGTYMGKAVDSLTLCLEDSVAVLRMGQSLLVREISSGKVLYFESESVDTPVVTVTSDGQLLVVFYDGSHLVKVFELSDSCTLLHSVSVSLEAKPIHKDRSVLVSRNSTKDYVLFAYRSGLEAAVLSAKEGKVVSTLRAQHPVASIQAVEMSAEYLLLFCRYPYKKHSEIVHIELFSVASFCYLRSILGCSQDYISQVSITKSGTHVVAFCPSPYRVTTEIITWNLETEDHKHVARFPGLLTDGVCGDLQYCLGIRPGEQYLHVWNLSSRINDQTLTYNVHKTRSDGTAEIRPVGNPPRYVVCGSVRQGTVRVWNIARGRCRGRPVRVEHGLFSGSDIALAQDLRLYILTDRSNATFTQTPMPVYQTLLVYDLIKRSYIKKQTGLFIIPCPPHDYKLLKGELLLGLSETRDHLIVWDLESGYIKGRIKPTHRESLLSSTMGRENQSQTLPATKTTDLVMPWDRRTESHTAKRRRLEQEEQREREEQRQLEKEKYNSIDQHLLSGNQQVVVCSYFAHHLNVFSLVSQEHLHTLEDRSSLLGLRTAAITHTGSHLALANYSQAQRMSYLTLWDLDKGKVQRRLRNEPGICCVTIRDDATKIAFGIAGINKLKVWEPFRRKHRTISGYRGLQLGVASQLHMTEDGAKAILLAGELSVWDLTAGTVLSVFTPDARIQCLSVLPEDGTLLLGFSDAPTLITMKLTSQGASTHTKPPQGQDLFGESSSSEDEEDLIEETKEN